MAHDCLVTEQPGDVTLSEPGHALELEVGECPPERRALAQDRQPREAGLKPLEAELLEQPHVI